MKHPLAKHCLITVFILATSYATCQEAQKPSVEDAQSVTSRWENWRRGLSGDDKVLIDKLDTLQASFEQSTVILGRLAQASVSPSTKEMVISIHGGYHLTECLLHGLYRMEQMNLWTTENEKAADLNAFTIVPFYMNFLHHAQDVHGVSANAAAAGCQHRVSRLHQPPGRRASRCASVLLGSSPQAVAGGFQDERAAIRTASALKPEFSHQANFSPSCH